MLVEGFHRAELAALCRAAVRFGGLDKIRPIIGFGETFDRRSIAASCLWYESVADGSSRIEHIENYSDLDGEEMERDRREMENDAMVFYNSQRGVK